MNKLTKNKLCNCMDSKCSSNLVLNSNIFEMLTPGICDKMGVLNSSIATGTDDKLSLIFNTLFEHHVCSHPTSMETHSQGKFLMEIVLIALKNRKTKIWMYRQKDGKDAKRHLALYKAGHNKIQGRIEVWSMNWQNSNAVKKGK